MRLRSMEITELPDREVLFLKKWQSNGLYPIEVAERISDGWVTYWLENKKHGACSYTDKTFLYKLQNNIYLVSDTPMHNENKFNFE